MVEIQVWISQGLHDVSNNNYPESEIPRYVEVHATVNMNVQVGSAVRKGLMKFCRLEIGRHSVQITRVSVMVISLDTVGI
jgi:hypothetical protein